MSYVIKIFFWFFCIWIEGRQISQYTKIKISFIMSSKLNFF